MADAPADQLGTWVFDGDPSGSVTPLDALKERFDGRVRIVYDPILSFSREETCLSGRRDPLFCRGGSHSFRRSSLSFFHFPSRRSERTPSTFEEYRETGSVLHNGRQTVGNEALPCKFRCPSICISPRYNGRPCPDRPDFRRCKSKRQTSGNLSCR